jgi:hypothetical protein
MPITMQVFGRTYAGSNYGLIYIIYSTSIMFITLLLAEIDLNFVSTSYVLALGTFLGFLNLSTFTYFAHTEACKDDLNLQSLVTVPGDIPDESLEKSNLWYNDYKYDVGL